MSDYFQEDQAPQKAYDAHLMRRLLGYLSPYRGRVFLAIVLLAVSKVTWLAGPYLVKVGIDEGIRGGNQVRLYQVAVLYLLFLGLEFLLSYAQTILVQTLGQRFMLDLRLRLFAHLERLSIRFFDRNPVGRLMTRITGDVEVLNEMFTSGLIAIFGDVFMLVGIMIMLLVLSPRLALVTFSLLPVLAAITFYFRTQLRRNFRQVRTRIARINAYLQERITGMEVIQAFVQERRSLERFCDLNREHMRSHLETVFNFALFWPLVELIATSSIALILWFGGRWVAGGEVSGLTLGGLAAFILYARRFFQPLSDLSEKFNIMQAAMASSERIFGLLDTEFDIRSPAGPRLLPTCRGEIEFEDVHFRYNPEEPVLGGVSFRVEAGQRIALVGPTGGGKSTLLSLLLRFYDPDTGSVKLDGVDLRELPLDQLRGHLALVQQDVFLFPGTIAENIHLGNPGIDAEDLRTAARAVGALDFIERLPAGFETRLHARGGGLSTGQKQLIAFARALAYDPAVLILDEATSSVDTETERAIQSGLENLLAGRTSLVVAHRLSTIQNSDRILVVHRGLLTESGSHEELLARGGLYARFHRLQFLSHPAAEADPSLLEGGFQEGDVDSTSL